MEMVMAVPVVTGVYAAAEVGLVKVMILLVESMSTPQLVPVLGQLARVLPLATLSKNWVPVAISMSLQVRVERLKPAGKVRLRVLEVVPAQGGVEQAWLV